MSESKHIAVEEKTQAESNDVAVEETQGWGKYIRIGVTCFVTFACCTLVFFLVFRYQEFVKLLKRIILAAQPIIFGLVLAYLLNPVMKFFERPLYGFFRKRMKEERKARKTARALAVTGAVIFLLLLIGFLIAAIVPAIVSSIASLIDTLPKQVDSFVSWINNGVFGDTQWSDIISDGLIKATDYVEEWAQETLLPQAQTYITQITSGVFSILKGLLNFIIGIIVAVYVMMIQETLTGQSKKIVYAIFRPRYGNVIIHTVRKSNEIFGGFITGKILDSAIIGVICYIGCLILRMPYAVLIAVIIGATNIIPFFGPIIGAIPCLLLVVIQNPLQALYLLIFVLVLQQVDGNIIGPKILGNSTGLSSFWVMFAILIAGSLFGFIGMLFGVPVFAVIYYIISKLVKHGLRKRGLPEGTSVYIQARGINEESNTLRYAQKPVETEEKQEETE